MADISPQQREEAMYAAAGRVRSSVEEHLRSRGGRRFLSEAADDVHVAPLPSEGMTLRSRIEIRKRGVALRYFGGVVRPRGNISELTGKPTKSLLIPGKELRATDGEFIDVVKNPKKLHVIKSKAGKILPVEDIPVKKKGEKDSMRIYGQPEKRTVHKPNPRVLPIKKTMSSAARSAAEVVLRDINFLPES